MIKHLENLCNLCGTSGDENSVRDYILREIKDYAECSVTPLGNIIAFKKGKNKTDKKVMIDAHMDEVGIIVSNVTQDGFLKFHTVGGINSSALLCRKVVFGNGTIGVIGCKPIHLTKGDEAKKAPKSSDMYIDIGARDKDEALCRVSIGDSAVFVGNFEKFSDTVFKSKAIDDRAGCAMLIDLIQNDSEYDFHASFSVQEEVGLRGAATSTYTINPDFAIVLEGTTAADLNGVAEESRVCTVGNGPAVSFMDGATLYDRALYNAAVKSGLICQPKAAVAGGNNAGAIHKSVGGVRTVAVSVPCRYIHSSSSIADEKDIENGIKLAKYMLNYICSGKAQ